MVEEQRTFFKTEVLQLESLGDSVVRVSVGQVGVGKITELNGQSLSSLRLRKKELLHLLCSSALENIMIDSIGRSVVGGGRGGREGRGSYEENKSFDDAHVVDKDEDDFIICYRQIPDGVVGATLERINEPSEQDEVYNQDYDFLTGSLEVVDKSVRCTTLSVGEIIVAVNGISLLQMTAENAIALLSNTSNRRLTIVRKHARLLLSSPVKKRSKVGDMADQLTSEASPFRRSFAARSPIRKEFEVNLDSWKDIRSNYINRKLHAATRSSLAESDEIRSAYNHEQSPLVQRLVKNRLFDLHTTK